MNRECDKESINTLLVEIWEGIEIQFYGIIGATLFFVLLYLFFQPPWMKYLVDFFNFNFFCELYLRNGGFDY